MEEGLRLRLQLHRHPELTGQGLEDSLEREEVRRPCVSPPARRRQGSGGEGGDAVRLECGRRPRPGELAAEWPPRGRTPFGEIDATGLEEGDAFGGAGEVVASGIEERSEQGGPELGVL